MNSSELFALFGNPEDDLDEALGLKHFFAKSMEFYVSIQPWVSRNLKDDDSEVDQEVAKETAERMTEYGKFLRGETNAFFIMKAISRLNKIIDTIEKCFPHADEQLAEGGKAALTRFENAYREYVKKPTYGNSYNLLIQTVEIRLRFSTIKSVFSAFAPIVGNVVVG